MRLFETKTGAVNLAVPRSIKNGAVCFAREVQGGTAEPTAEQFQHLLDAGYKEWIDPGSINEETHKWGPIEETETTATRSPVALTAQEIVAKLETDRAGKIEEVKNLRRDTLDKIQKNSEGISTVYRENLRAAERYQAGDTSAMPDGQTPTQYLTGLGAEIGMNAATFAQWIIDENERLGPGAFDVEKNYLGAKVIISSVDDRDIWDTTVADYRALCNSVPWE